MNNTKHTPGPWTVQKHPGNIFIWPGKPSENGPPLIASVNAWDKNCAANAALIAAAPAMYEALSDAEGMWNIARMIDSKYHAGNPISNDLWSDFHQYLMKWHAKRKAALAQAEGR